MGAACKYAAFTAHGASAGYSVLQDMQLAQDAQCMQYTQHLQDTKHRYATDAPVIFIVAFILQCQALAARICIC